MKENGIYKERLLSLDTFRGIAIAGMIVVNNQGDWSHVYAPLRHAAWHGITPADLVFPLFLFIMGVAISFSVDNRVAKGVSVREIVPAIFIRSIMLIVFGLLLNFPADLNFSCMRFPGVLQRIGLCYCIVSMIAICRTSKAVVVMIGLLTLYWLLMIWVPVPGFGSGNLGPEGNVCTFIDRAVFGLHTYHYSLAPGFDPEGILSTIPAVPTALFGLLSGRWLRYGTSKNRVLTIPGLVLSGIFCIIAGLVLNLCIPINKNLWTPSYVVFTGGIAQIVLAFLYYILEIQQYRRYAVLLAALGLNSIVVYILSSVVGYVSVSLRIPIGNGSMLLKQLIFSTLFAPWLRENAASLVYSLAYLLIWGLFALFLYRKEIVIKV